MATETVNTIWPEAFKDESPREDSVTSMNLLENADNLMWSPAKSKRTAFVEEETEFGYNTTGVINGYIFKPTISVPDMISPEVVAESEANGWTDELEKAIELAKTTYTSLKKIELLLEKDPEITDRETLRFIFTVSGNPEQILEEESKFKKQIRNTIRQQIRDKITVTYYWK